MENLGETPQAGFGAALLMVGLGLACALGVTGPAQAQLARVGEVGPASATLNRNVYAGGGQVHPSGPVRGDFTAGGGKVVVDQPIGGDASVAGGSVDIRASVGDDVRAAGGDVSIESAVAGELFAAGGNVSVTPAAAVGRGATLYGSSVEVDGRIDGDLNVTAQKISINGEVRGNTRLVAEEIELGPQARIRGTLSYASKAELKKAAGAMIAGAVTREEDHPGQSNRPGRDGGWERSVQGPYWISSAISFLALLAFAVIFLLIAPRFGDRAADRIQYSPWLALAVGFGSVVAIPFLALLLFVTLLGIPLAIAVMALYPALMLAGFVIGILFIARLLRAAMRKPPPLSFKATLGYFAASLLLTLLVARVPLVGGLLIGLLSVCGVGGCVLELYWRRKGTKGGLPAERTVPNVAPQA